MRHKISCLVSEDAHEVTHSSLCLVHHAFRIFFYCYLPIILILFGVEIAGMSGTEKSSSTLGQKAILLRLPNEILQQIISYLSGASIPAIQRSCCRLYSLVDSLTWRRLCQTEFRYWDPDRDVRNKFDTALNQVDWRGIFAERYCTKQRVTSLLDSILSSQVGRIGKFQQIVEMGYDAKDCLLEHLAVDDDTDDVLARR